MKHFANADLGRAVTAGILDTLCKSGPRRSGGGGNPWNSLQKRAALYIDTPFSHFMAVLTKEIAVRERDGK